MVMAKAGKSVTKFRILRFVVCLEALKIRPFKKTGVILI